ncbi:MAG TPA: TrkH family potassium uptake protein [Symbiobacteriaceae bacterium]
MYLPLRSPKRRLSFTPAQVLVLGFAGLSFVGSLLLWAPFSQEPGRHISYLDALFTATSATCVNGLAVVDTASQFSTTGELIILALIQAGGLGIMTLSALMFMLMGKRITLRERLMMQEALGSFSIAGVVRLTRNIILTTLGIEAVGVLLLALRFALEYPLAKAWYWGLFLGISAYNNAGFDVTSVSLRSFSRDPFVLFVIGMLITLGGIGYMVLEDLWRNRHRRDNLSLHTRLVVRVTLWIIGVGTLLLLALEWGNPNTFGNLPWYHKIVNAWFAAVTPRSGGFESVPTGMMLDASLLVTMIIMFVGASPGGTGGGIKTTTFAMLGLVVRKTARGMEEIQVMDRQLPRDLVDKALTITVIVLALVITGTGILLVTEGPSMRDPAHPVTFIQILFEVISAVGNVGLSTGLTPRLSPIGRVLIIVMMFIGRVGPLTMATALAQRKSARSPLHYPEDRVMIG